MEKNIEIDGRLIPFKATGLTPVLYRRMFKADIFQDMAKLTKNIQTAQATKEETGEDISVLDLESLELFERIAYVMAKQADGAIPGMDEWLDGFNVFSVYTVLPEIIELWNLNNIKISESKKNIDALTAK